MHVVFSDRRLADHFGGKLHLGYMQIREKLAELQVSSLNLIVMSFLGIQYFLSLKLKFTLFNILPK